MVFLLHIILVLKVVPLGAEFAADRYVYLASIGVFFVVAQLLVRLGAVANRSCWPVQRSWPWAWR